MRIVGYHINLNDRVIVNSDGESVHEPPYLDFLLAEKPDTIKVFYDLSYDVAQLLRLIGCTERECETLYKKNNLYKAPYQFRYLRKRNVGGSFSVKDSPSRNANLAQFSDIKQYNQDLSLEVSAEDGAKQAQVIGEQIYNALVNLGLEPKSLTSPIRPFINDILSDLDLPTVDHLPEQVAEFAYNCTKGGWVEAYQKGHFAQTWDYDIRTAYASWLSMMPDHRAEYGWWKKGNTYETKAVYGFCHGVVTINAPFSPIIFSRNEQETFTPTGEWETYLTKAEIDFIHKHKIGSFKPIECYWWLPRKPYLYYPWQRMIKGLNEQKDRSEGYDRLAVKRILEGLWGLTLQINNPEETERDPFGLFFNPVIGAEVESRTRLQVAQFVLDNNLYPDNLLHIAVDGVLTSCPVEIQNSGAMGDWKLASSGLPCFVVSSGIVALKDKEQVGDFALRYDWLLEQIKHNQKATEFSMFKKSPISLAKAIQQKKFDKLGELEDITKTVDIGYELKRLYRDCPETGEDLLNNKYQSYPQDISLVQSGLI